MSRRFIASRRGGARGSGGRAPSGPPLVGLTGYSAANYTQTADPGGPPGLSTGFYRVWFGRLLATGVSATRVLLNRYTAPTPVAGYVLQTTGTHAILQFFGANGAGGVVSAPSYTVQAGDVGKDIAAVGWHDGSNLRLAVHRLQVGSGSVIAGYTAGATLTRAGNRSTNTVQPATDVTTYGVMGGEVAPTLTQVEAIFDAIKASGKVVAVPGLQCDYLVPFENAAAQPDLAGADDNMTTTGTLTLVSNARNWGW